ncbi:hypothetical protein [Lacipirellula sp.]|uniref:hypothetical protein n=1 Tax=Lacipirellula sp. TaxID=2691419 RepID=UPI003D1459BC
MSDLPRTTISAAAIASHVIPALDDCFGDDFVAIVTRLTSIDDKAERIAASLESIAASLSTFQQ